MTAAPNMAITEPVQRLLDADTTLALLGIDVLSADAGAAVATMTIREDHANGHGIAHGGLVYTLADTAFACAASSLVPGSATVAAGIDYLSPAHVGETLTADARVRQAGPRQALVDVTVRCGGRVIAEYRGRSARLRRPAHD